MRLPEPGGEPRALAPTEHAAAAIDADRVGDCRLFFGLHIGEVLLVAFPDALEIVQDGLALACFRIGVHSEIDWGVGSLADCLRLGESTLSVMLSLSTRKVSHVRRVALFVTTYDPEPRVFQRSDFGMGQIPQIALYKANTPTLV